MVGALQTEFRLLDGFLCGLIILLQQYLTYYFVLMSRIIYVFVCNGTGSMFMFIEKKVIFSLCDHTEAIIYASRFRLCKNFVPVSLFFFTALFRLRTQRMPMFWFFIVYIPCFGNPKGVMNCCCFCFQFKIINSHVAPKKHPSHHKIHKVVKLN